MVSAEIQTSLDSLKQLDVDNADRDQLSEMVRTSSQIRGGLDSFDLRCARRARLLAKQGRSEPAESLLGRQGKLSGKQAKILADRESVADSMSGFEDALGAGQVSTGHLDAIAAATRGLDADITAEFTEHEDELLTNATSEGVDTFTRRCRQLARTLNSATGMSDAEELDAQRKQSNVKRWVDKISGMHHTHLELDPLRDSKLWSVIETQLAKMCHTDANTQTPWNQLQVEAVIATVEAGLNTGPNSADPARRVPEITALIDLHTLTSGLHDNSICETENGVPLPVSTIRRLCCDAEIIPVVLDGDGTALDVGRSKRTATPHQRTALRAMYTTCGRDNCTVPFSKCRIHHIKWWWKDLGPTNLDNLIPLCDADHHLVHEGGWTLQMTPDRVTTWTRPDGVIAHNANSTNRASPNRSHNQPPPDTESPSHTSYSLFAKAPT